MCEQMESNLQAQLLDLLHIETKVKIRLTDMKSSSMGSASLQTPYRGRVADLEYELVTLQAKIQNCKGQIQILSNFKEACLVILAADSLADFQSLELEETVAQLDMLETALVERGEAWVSEQDDAYMDTIAVLAYTNHHGLARDAEDKTLREKIALARAVPLPPRAVWKAKSIQVDVKNATVKEARLAVMTRASIAAAIIERTSQSIPLRHAGMEQATASQQPVASQEHLITAGAQLIPAGYAEQRIFLRRALQQQRSKLHALEVSHSAQARDGVSDKQASPAAAVSWLGGILLENDAERRACEARAAGLGAVLLDREPGPIEACVLQRTNMAHLKSVQPLPRQLHF